MTPASTTRAGIDRSNALYCWGSNQTGELGLGTTGFRENKNVPTRVGTANDWTDISASGGFTCGIRSGALFCWDANMNGQLGIGDTASRATPTQVGARNDWKQVTAGGAHSCATRSDGVLFSWGDNTNGAVGDGTNEQRLLPVQVVGTAAGWTDVAAGGRHTCGIRADGVLFCWGDNFFGQLGDGTRENSRNTPTQVGTATGWTKVGPGEAHTCAIRNGALYCFGSNANGALGNGTFGGENDPGNPNPTQVGTRTDWTNVAGGPQSSCGIRTDKLLFCWGTGPTGDGTNTTYAVPTQAQFDKWTSVSLGLQHRLGLRNLE